MTVALDYTTSEATDLDHILTILGRILTGMAKLGHYVWQERMAVSVLLSLHLPRSRRCLGIDDGKPFCLNQAYKRTISTIDVSNHLRPNLLITASCMASKVRRFLDNPYFSMRTAASLLSLSPKNTNRMVPF